jgi:hypothetical protein
MTINDILLGIKKRRKRTAFFQMKVKKYYSLHPLHRNYNTKY